MSYLSLLLLSQENLAGTRAVRGRLPRCVVLAPTRELANQVAREFESASSSIKVASFYGGVSIIGQVGATAAASCDLGYAELCAAGVLRVCGSRGSTLGCQGNRCSRDMPMSGKLLRQLLRARAQELGINQPCHPKHWPRR